MSSIKKILYNSSGIAIGLFIISISIAAVGLTFVNIANHSVTAQQYAEKWNQATANILSAEIEFKKEKQHPKIEYEYSFNGESFSNSRLFFSEGPYEKVEALPQGVQVTVRPPKGEEMETYQWRVGDNVKVYFNPHNPRESVLIRYALGEMKMFMIVGVIAIVFGLFGIAQSLFYESVD